MSGHSNAKSRQTKMLLSFEEFIPEYILKCHESVLYKIKLIDLYSFYEEFKKSDNDQNPSFCLPILTKPLLKNPRFFSQQLAKCIKSFLTPKSPKKIGKIDSSDNNPKNLPFSKYIFHFFSRKQNEIFLGYFIKCFFPTIFCNFSSEDFISLGYQFIESYSTIEKKYKEKNKISKLQSKDLIPIFILHNFHFQVECFDTFYRLVFQKQNNDRDTILIALLNSFESNLRFLHSSQLQLLVNLSKNINFLKEILKDILINLISVCSYSPGFCATGILSNDFISFICNSISNSQSDEDKSKNSSRVNVAINQLINTIKKNLKSQISTKSNQFGHFDIMSNQKILLSDYDVILFSRILQEGGELSIDGANMNREYIDPSDFFTPISAFRIFYIDVNFDINCNSDQVSPSPKQRRSTKDQLAFSQSRTISEMSLIKQSFIQQTSVRTTFTTQPGVKFEEKKTDLLEKAGSLSFMKTQKEASKKFLKIVMLKYSDKNYYYKDNTSGSIDDFVNDLSEYLTYQRKLINPDLNPDIISRESVLYNKLFTQYRLNQCLIYLNNYELNCDPKIIITISTDVPHEYESPFDFYFNNFISIVNFPSNVENKETCFNGFRYVALEDLLPSIMSLKKSHNDIASLIPNDEEKIKFFKNFEVVFSALQSVPDQIYDYSNIKQNTTNIAQFISICIVSQ